MLKCVADLRKSLTVFLQAGVIPLRRKIARTERDEFGVWKFILRAARGDVECISTNYVMGLPAHHKGGTFLVSPSDVLGFSHLPLVFEYVFESEYAQYRKNYPRRPKINVPPPASEPILPVGTDRDSVQSTLGEVVAVEGSAA
jgi:hypothetical protein